MTHLDIHKDIPDENDPNFITCEKNNCNILPVPRNRIRCFQCDENIDETCSISNNTFPPLQYCPKYNVTEEEEECYTKIDKSSKQITRGCKSDFGPDEDFCEEDTCKRCTYEGCNRDPKYSKPQLFCIKCEATSDRNNSCLWGHHFSNAEQCETIIEFGIQEACFTSINKDGAVNRGCLNDVQNVCSDNDPNSCRKCDLSGCNNDNVVKQSCVICNSTVDPTCENSNPTIKMKECPMDVQVFDERWCFTYRNLTDRSVHRGCFSDLTEDLKQICLKEKQNVCDICDIQGCNTGNPPNSSTKPMMSVIYVAFLFISYLM